MPLYEYHCSECGLFEVIQDSDKVEDTIECSECGRLAARVFSPPTFCRVFSGTRHTLQKRADRSFEPRLMSHEEKTKTLGQNTTCGHGHHHGQHKPHKNNLDRPWMMKH